AGSEKEYEKGMYYDEDWFYYDEIDTAGGIVDPWVRLDSQGGIAWPPGFEGRLCEYIVCKDGTTPTIDCGDLETTDPSEPTTPGPGCCNLNGVSGAEVRIKPSCQGSSDDSVRVYAYVHVIKGSYEPCWDYSLTFSP